MKTHTPLVTVLAILLALSGSSIGRLHAQAATATIQGTVADQSGAAIPDAAGPDDGSVGDGPPPTHPDGHGADQGNLDETSFYACSSSGNAASLAPMLLALLALRRRRN